MKQVLLTVGNGMMGDDGAGVLLGKLAKGQLLPDWVIIEGGSVPENCLHIIRDIQPDRILVVDAADMDLEPGSICRILGSQLSNPFLFSTHTLPLTFLLESLAEFCPDVTMLGIQPEMIAFGYPITAKVRCAVQVILDALAAGEDMLSWPVLEARPVVT